MHVGSTFASSQALARMGWVCYLLYGSHLLWTGGGGESSGHMPLLRLYCCLVFPHCPLALCICVVEGGIKGQWQDQQTLIGCTVSATHQLSVSDWWMLLRLLWAARCLLCWLCLVGGHMLSFSPTEHKL